MNAGDTFIPAKFDHHLWVIISEPSVDAEHVVIVNFTTHSIDEEPLCTINPGDHEFVKHKTAVRYRDAKIVSLPVLSRLLNSNQLRPHRPLSAELLLRVRGGAALSEFLPEGCREVLDRQGLL